MALFVRKRPDTGKGAGTSPPRPGTEPGTLGDRDVLTDIADRGTARAREQQRDRRSLIDMQTVADPGLANTPRVEPAAPAAQSGAATVIQSQAGHADLKSQQGKPEQTPEQGQPDQARAGEIPAEAAKAARSARLSLFGRLKRAVRNLFFLCAGLCVFVLSLLAVYEFSIWLYTWMHTSPMFVTKHIDITGNVRLQRDMILQLGGLKEGDNAFSVSVAAVEHRLRQTPWVEDVSVQRILPDRFVIRLQERMPSFWIRREGRLYYANERGEFIAPVESSNFMSLPILSIEPGSEDAIPYLSRLLRDIRSGILPVEAGAIATVDVSPSRGVELYLEDREMRLSLAPDDWDGNLVRLGATIGDLARRRELSSVQEVRTSRNSVWIVLRRPVDQQ